MHLHTDFVIRGNDKDDPAVIRLLVLIIGTTLL